MCREYSCIVFPDGSVLDGHPTNKSSHSYWTHSHSAILERHGIKDDNPTGDSFARVEIDLFNLYAKRETPLSKVESWLKIDQSITPRWFKNHHRKAALRSLLSYLKKVYFPKRCSSLILHESTIYRINEASRYTIRDGRKYSAIIVGTHRFRSGRSHKNPLYRKAIRSYRKYIKGWDKPAKEPFHKAFPLK